MDKRSLGAIALITVIVMAWLFYSSQHTQYPESKEQQESVDSSSQALENEIAEEETPATPAPISTKEEQLAEETENINVDSLQNYEKYGRFFAPYTQGYMEIITIETELVKAKLSRKGAALIDWQLREYKQWNGYQSQLIWSSDPERKGELYLTFVTKGAKKIDTRDLYFNFNTGDKRNFRLSGDDSLTITARLEILPGKYIEKKFTFFGNKYIVNTEVTLNGLGEILPTRGYNYVWSDGLKYQEYSTVDESSEAQAMASLNGEIADINADDDDPVRAEETGIIDYIGVKTKYFGAAIIPQPFQSFDGTVDLNGSMERVKKEGTVERYDVSFRIPYGGGKETQNFQVYIGPLDYDIVSEYGLNSMVYFGWGFISYIGEYLILPLFMFIHTFFANYGITIIVFSILMKFLLYPLSIQQMRSAQKMKLLGPEMEKLREKYKDDQKEQQKATMKLYSEYGINPAGGCLPLLLQMPILFALWSVLRTAIDLRQAEFFWWITDLSQPDIIIEFGFSILGIKFLSGLALLMGITMFFQQKLTITDPKQKAMVYMMPVMFTLIFSNLPSGLNLYYFMFNLFGIAQQVYINKFSKNRPTLATLKKSPKKEGWLQKKMREAQDMADKGGRSVPGRAGKSYNTGKQPQRRKKKKK